MRTPLADAAIKALAIVASLSLSACGAKNIRPNSGMQLQDDSAVLLLGMTPNWRIQMFRTHVEDDGTIASPSQLQSVEINTFPDNGYVIVKVKPTAASERISVEAVFPGMIPYMPCEDSRKPTFVLQAGKVNYVGDLDFTMVDGTPHYSSTSNPEKAQQFLTTYYPQYVSAFESHPMAQLNAHKGRCGNVTFPLVIPIYR